jgi:predicted dehydrogenase
MSGGPQHTPVRTALIGAGGFGGTHLERLRAFPCRQSCELVAVADPRFAWPDPLGEDLRAAGLRLYPDIHALLEAECARGLEAVVISTPIPLHYEMARACMERGLAVLLEKPPVPMLEQLDDLLALPGHERVAVSFQRIVSEPVRQMKRWIVEGRLGELRNLRTHACWPRLDTYYTRAPWAGRMTLGEQPVFDGPATNALSHVIHHLMYLGGSEFEGFARPAPDLVEGEFYRVRPGLESYDLCCLRGRLDSGVGYFAALTHAASIKTPFVVEARGERGWARLEDSGWRLRGSWGADLHYGDDVVNAYAIVYANLRDLVRVPGTRPATSLEDARGYLIATNLGLRASGGIRTVPVEYVSRFALCNAAGQPGHGYCIADIRRVVETAYEHQALFTEMDLPWAGRGGAGAILPNLLVPAVTV